MIRRLALPLLFALLGLAVGGCSGGEDLPEAQQLLARSAETMREVSSARFVLELAGSPDALLIEGAQGRLTRQGEAAGTVTITRGGQLAELQFVLTGDALYLKGPTGGFQKLPASFASSVYDPSLILDPQRGVAALLESATSATTEAREQVNGFDTYRVSATFPGDVLGGLLPVTGDTEGTVWIGAQRPYLVQARFELSGGAVIVQLSEFGAPVEITPPS